MSADHEMRDEGGGPASRLLDAERHGEEWLVRLAHELRTPLAAIQSTAEALGSGHLGHMENERHAGYVRSIAETAKHALAVVDAMYPYPAAAVNSAEREPGLLDLAVIAREVTAGMSLLAARAGVHLDVTESPGPMPRVRASATDVRQMLINLISNGIVHAGGGSTVRVETGAQDGSVWMAVVDSGSGIPQSVIDRLELGLPLDAGTGSTSASRMRLGLTLTRALAIANGGSLAFSSGSAGSEVRVVLPAA